MKKLNNENEKVEKIPVKENVKAYNHIEKEITGGGAKKVGNSNR
jgi:hypothetical protein